MMNRIILIGNGFDLAHGLPTSYKDFIQGYWIFKDADYWKIQVIQQTDYAVLK